MNNDTLEYVTSDKLLGVTVDHNLSWEKHITTIVSTINRKLALLRRIKRYMPLSTRKLFFNTQILPHIDYSAIIWGSSPHTQNLLLAQKRAAYVILDIKDIYHHSKDMLFSLKLMPIRDRIKFCKTIMLYKSVNDLTPNYMKDMFTYVRDSHSCTTRSSIKNDLYLPTGKHKELYIQSFAYTGANIWNSINPDIHNQQSLNSFKNACIKDNFSA